MSSPKDSDTTPKADVTNSGAGEKQQPAATEKPEQREAKQPEAVGKAAGSAEKPGDQKSDKGSTEKGKKPVSGKQKKSGVVKFLILFIVLVILVAALAGGGWWGYRYINTSLNEHLSQQNVAAKNAVSEQSMRLQSMLESEQQARHADMAELRQVTDDIRNRINSQSRRLKELSGTTRSDWLLAEAEYLIRLGIQRFITERNTTNSIALMESANQILSQLDEVDLLPVRRTLARDITSLRLINNIDREGLYLKLGAIGEVLMTIPLIPKQTSSVATPRQAVDIAAEQDWQERLMANFAALLQQLEGLITVRRHDNTLEPLLSLEEEVYIRQNLRFMIEQAQLALLREEGMVYRESLHKAAGWIDNYFQVNEQSQNLVAEINKLADRQIEVDYPDISGGLESLRDFIDNRHRRYGLSGNNSVKIDSAVPKTEQQDELLKGSPSIDSSVESTPTEATLKEKAQ